MASLYLARRMLLELARSRRVLVLWVVFPVAMLLLFGRVRSASMESIGASLAHTAPGILIGAALFFSCLGGPVSVIAGERERGTASRLGSTPMSGRQYFAGLTLAHLGVALAQAILVYGITYGAGGRIEGSVAGCVVVFVLCTVAYVGAGFVIGTRWAAGAEEINGTVAGIGVPLLVLGGTFFPADTLPSALHAAAQLDPVFHMNEAFRSMARGEAGLRDVWPSLLVLCGFTVVAMAWGSRAWGRLLAGRKR